MILSIILLIIFLASFAMLFREGLWNNAITLINLISAGLLATTLWEPVASYFDGQSTFTYLIDFLSLWVVFCISFTLFRGVTGYLSKTAVRFKKPVDLAGGVLLAVWISWVLVGFTMMTLHTAPLHRDLLWGSYPGPETKVFFGYAPDRDWLAFVQKLSRGSLATSPPEGVEGELGVNVFDPEASFIYKYAERRYVFERQSEIRVRRN